MMDVIGVGVGVGAGAKKDATDVAEDSACSAIAGVFFFLRSRSPMRRLKQWRCVKLIGKMSTDPEDEELFPLFHSSIVFFIHPYCIHLNPLDGIVYTKYCVYRSLIAGSAQNNSKKRCLKFWNDIDIFCRI